MNGTQNWCTLVDLHPEDQAAGSVDILRLTLQGELTGDELEHIAQKAGRKTYAMVSGRSAGHSLASELVESHDGHEEIIKVYLKGRSGDKMSHEKSINQLKSEARNCLQKLREDISSKLDRDLGDSLHRQEKQVVLEKPNGLSQSPPAPYSSSPEVDICINEDVESLRKTVKDLLAKLQEAERQHQSDRVAFEVTLSQYQREAEQSNAALQREENRVEQKEAEVGELQRRVLGMETVIGDPELQRHVLGMETVIWDPELQRHVLGMETVIWDPELQRRVLGMETVIGDPELQRHVLGMETVIWDPELQRCVLGMETEHQALLAKVREGEMALEELRSNNADGQAEREKAATLEKEVAGLREKIHHLDDMLKSQQRKVRQMIEQLQNSKAVIQSKDATIQELKEKIAYLEAENLEMHERMEHLIEKQISHGNFSTQARAKTENSGSIRISKPPSPKPMPLIRVVET
ncbi:tuftelin isoform X2 [Callithrix jacchus]|uniref:tuftelin isoform X2 n=1 Tax=Callithrix jacchus TaxID=9483 RepID=UPI00159D7C67|nr:tuftelin isoform X2 [Callithrix jacchus]